MYTADVFDTVFKRAGNGNNDGMMNLPSGVLRQGWPGNPRTK
jgi:hypothetical protein